MLPKTLKLTMAISNKGFAFRGLVSQQEISAEYFPRKANPKPFLAK